LSGSHQRHYFVQDPKQIPTAGSWQKPPNQPRTKRRNGVFERRASAERKVEQLSKSNRERKWHGTVLVWVTGLSALTYFVTSYTVKNHFIFLWFYLNKALSILNFK